MVALAAKTGTTDIVATPHSNLEYRFQPELIAARLAEVRAAVGDAIRIHLGCDFHLHYDNIQDALAHPAKYTINGKSYLLVEFSDLMIFKNTAAIFERLLMAGMVPVVTHPERNLLLHQRLEEIQGWVEMGGRLQVTAQSLLGRFGQEARDFSETLLRRGLVHFVASDAHDSRSRPPRLDEAFAWVARKYGQESAERLFVLNPGAALRGEMIDTEPPEPPAPARKWYYFWRS